MRGSVEKHIGITGCRSIQLATVTVSNLNSSYQPGFWPISLGYPKANKFSLSALDCAGLRCFPLQPSNPLGALSYDLHLTHPRFARPGLPTWKRRYYHQLFPMEFNAELRDAFLCIACSDVIVQMSYPPTLRDFIWYRITSWEFSRKIYLCSVDLCSIHII